VTYLGTELSVDDGFPIELYTFSRGSFSWRYTSADEDKTVASVVYESAQIKRDSFKQTQEMSKSTLGLTLSRTLSVLDQFKVSPPTDIIQVVIQRYHEGDGEVTTPWAGRIINVKFLEKEAEIKCEPIYTSLKRPALRRRYQTACPYVLYGSNCTLDRANFLVNGVVDSVNGLVLESSAFGAFADGYFSGGYTSWAVSGNTETRFIIDHVGDFITINLPFTGGVGTALQTYPGCDHILNTCINKFNNVVNYGGQPFFPRKNPMGGNPVF